MDKDYILVFFAAETKHRPDVSWILKTYSSLDRKYKKNMKKLYIVHASIWTKLILDVMKTVVSSKSKAKLQFIDSLAQLHGVVDLDKFILPNCVLK
jgi:Rho GTPase-activating protein 1